MPHVSGRFGPYPLRVTLDGSGNGTVAFQAVGQNIRITNLYTSVSSTVAQATATAYKGQISPQNAISSTNSGSSGATATGQIDLFDGESCYVQWVGGTSGAIATATFSGVVIPFDQVQATDLVWSDPIAAGDGGLIYPALKSPNYVAGVSGWSINRDGTFELSGGTFRGDVYIVDTPSGAFIHGYANGSTAEFDFQPPTVGLNPGVIYDPGRVLTASGGDQAYMQIWGPSRNDIASTPATVYIGADSTDPSQGEIGLNAGSVIIGDYGPGPVVPTTTELRAEQTEIAGDLRLEGQRLFRRIGQTSISAWSSASSKTATVTFSSAMTSANPRVFCNIADNASVLPRTWAVRANSISSTGFTINLFTVDSSSSAPSGTVHIDWLAIGDDV